MSLHVGPATVKGGPLLGPKAMAVGIPVANRKKLFAGVTSPEGLMIHHFASSSPVLATLDVELDLPQTVFDVLS